MKTGDTCILFFVKFPEAGSVKTRLAADIGPERAAEIYECFIRDLNETLNGLGCDVLICYSPRNKGDGLKRILGEDKRYYAQEGEGLGERMKNAFRYAFSLGSSHVVIIGSDSPDLPEPYLRDAIESIRSSDCVIGPAADGGYYLLGFRDRTFLPEVFDDIPWSTGTVFPLTMEKFRKAGYLIGRLPQWRDIDSFEDLNHLYGENRDGEFMKSRTISYLASMPEFRK